VRLKIVGAKFRLSYGSITTLTSIQTECVEIRKKPP
jgi:hypothetical protein